MNTQKRKKLLSVTMSVITAMGIMMGGAAQTFAATIHESTTEDVTASLTKNFVMPSGVTQPAAGFEFSYTKDGVVVGASNVSSSVSADSTQPNLTALDGTGDITYTANGTKTGTVSNKDVYVKTIQNIVPAASAFSHAGEYVYTITETADTNSAIDAGMTYSQAEYKMHVFVKNNNGGLLVAGVAVYQTKNDAGQTGTMAKVDLDNNSYISGTGNDFAFNNVYAPCDESLKISKTVSGDYADLTKEFNISVTLNNPATATNTEYKAVIVNTSDMKPVSTTEYEFDAGIATPVTLKTGQQLVFIGDDVTPSTDTALTAADIRCLPAGMTYEVVENGVADYTPKAVVTHGGTTDSQLSGTAGQNFLVNTNTLVDTGSNITALESIYQSIAVTGIIIKLLPALMLILIAAIGITNSIVSSRRESE